MMARVASVGVALPPVRHTNPVAHLRAQVAGLGPDADGSYELPIVAAGNGKGVILLWFPALFLVIEPVATAVDSS